MNKTEIEINEKTKLELQASVIRGLINYHKRMLAACEQCGVLYEPGEFKIENKNSSEITFQKDVYLGAMETALQLFEREIIRVSEK